MKELFTFIAVTVGQRYKPKSKKAFTEYVATEFDSIGYKVRIDDQTSKGKRMINLFFGDVKNAKTIVMAGYDTPPSGIRIKKEYYPFDYARNKQNAVRNLTVQAIVSVILISLLPLGYLLFWSDADLTVRIVLSILGVIILGCMYFISGGSGNPVNFNRNSAALTILFELARKEKKKEAAYVLVDKTCLGFEGYKAVLSRFGADESKYRFIILDCVGHGEVTEIISTARASDDYGAINAMPNTNLRVDSTSLPINLFTKCIQISGGQPDDRSVLVVNNTGGMKDTVVDIDYMHGILNLLKKLT